MLNSQMTVDQRRQQNGGFMTSSGNRMLNRADAEPQAETQPAPAPNLREGEPGHECMSCGHYEMGSRQCKQFNFGPKPFQVCDAYSETAAAAPEENPVAPPVEEL
jgi:hypothetical protein